jgi:CheY-like chemotaxis protein
MSVNQNYTQEPMQPVNEQGPLRILIVENDPDIRDVLSLLFTDVGYVFEIHEDLEEIIPAVQAFHPDLILLDYMLSKVNGGELCGQVKRNPDFSQIPVILYSAFPKVFLSLGDYGCDLFIPKPFDLNNLITQIERLVKRSA